MYAAFSLRSVFTVYTCAIKHIAYFEEEMSELCYYTYYRTRAPSYISLLIEVSPLRFDKDLFRVGSSVSS